MLELSEHIASDAFAKLARHPDHPTAFTRHRKLPLQALIAALLSMGKQSQQTMLDDFFSSICGSACALREVSDRAFAKARERLHQPALVSLNDLVVNRAEQADLIQRWHGLRVVAADASVLMAAVRPCHLKRSPAHPDQRLFALYLPGAELTLHARVYSALQSERAMLVQALDCLGPDDVLVLDRGYPAAWLVSLLSERGIRFVMRCDNRSGWKAAKAFARSAQAQAWVTLNAPSADDVRDWKCAPGAPRVRLIRQTAPNGQVRLLATNLHEADFPPTLLADLYHQRWRIEEAFKRLKHRLHLECVSGLTQQALIIDVAAKILADNIAALMCMAAQHQADLPARARHCNRAYAATLMRRLLPRFVLLVEDVCSEISQLLTALAANTTRHVAGRSRPRPHHHIKPHPSCAYKG